MNNPANGNTPRTTTPPYVGWPSYNGMLSGFKEHVLPGRIDRSVLSNFSGIVGTQLLATLRFMGQIDSASAPTDLLKRLVNARGTDDWPQELAEQIKRAYAPLFELQLETASPAQFNEKFRAAFPCEGDTLRKAMSFFLNACRDAKIPISTFIMKNKKPRSGNGPRKPRTPKAAAAPKGNEEKPGTKNAAGTSTTEQADDFRQQLLTKFPEFDPSWSNELKAEWFKGFEQFMNMAKK